MSTQEVVKKEVARMKNSVKREVALENDLQSYKATLKEIGDMIEESKPMPEGSNYTSFEEWQKDVEKKIKARTTSLATIEKYKDIIVAHEFYLEKNPQE